MDKLLEVAMDTGLLELDFWNMTVGEVNRHIESYNRRHITAAKEKANSDYILANLIGKSIGIILGDKSPMPTLQEAYSNLFEGESQQEEDRTDVSALRFKLFAQSYNQRYKERSADKTNE